MTKEYVKVHLGVMNIAARIVGCGFIVVGVALLLTAIFGSEARLTTAIFAVLGIAIGTAFLSVRPVKPEDIENLLDGKSPPRRTGTYERRK
jgi:hypothetical protein